MNCNNVSFNKYYFTEEPLNEILGLQWLAGHWKDFDPRNSMNFLRKIAGSTSRKIIPKQYNTTEVSQKGYSNIFGKLTADINKSNKERLKYYIKELFNGKWNDKDASDNIAEILGDQESTAVYRLNNGGAIVLYHIKDQEGDDRYFVGIDGSGEKYFAAPNKQGGLGMLFKSWIAAQKSQDVFSLSDISKGEKTKKTKGIPFKVEINKNDYSSLVPNPEKMKQNKVSWKDWKFPLAASVEYDKDLYDLFVEDICFINEEEKYVFKDKDGKWIVASSSKNNPIEFSFNPKHNYIAVKTDEPTGSKEKAKKLDKDEDLQKELDELIKNEQNPPTEDTNTEETPETNTIDTKTNDVEDKPEITTDTSKNKQALGILAFELDNELKQAPNSIQPTDKVKNGWRYVLKNNGVIFIYQNKNNKYFIGYDDKAKSVVDKTNIINKYGLTQSPESPE
ncbi:MAG: hypothetical protein PHF86_11815 [Candidatus Nanoarchaeia archaeon]|nr:hypothetical protein [Candidatus Nanoarchaeia archaeon]